jgi:TatD DNase family protein
VTEIAYRLNGNCYLNITDRCSLRCRFCPKFGNEWQVRGHDLRLRHQPSLAEITAALPAAGECREVVFCGLGEPTRRLYTMLSVADRLQRRGLRVRLNTDGLANRRAAQDITPDLAGRIDALSVSLNAQDPRTYERHCRPPFAHAWGSVIDFVRAARQHVSDITVTAIDGLPGVDIDDCARIAQELGVKFRRRVLDQVG